MQHDTHRPSGFSYKINQNYHYSFRKELIQGWDQGLDLQNEDEVHQ